MYRIIVIPFILLAISCGVNTSPANKKKIITEPKILDSDTSWPLYDEFKSLTSMDTPQQIEWLVRPLLIDSLNNILKDSARSGKVLIVTIPIIRDTTIVLFNRRQTDRIDLPYINVVVPAFTPPEIKR